MNFNHFIWELMSQNANFFEIPNFQIYFGNLHYIHLKKFFKEFEDFIIRYMEEVLYFYDEEKSLEKKNPQFNKMSNDMIVAEIQQI